MSSMTRRRQGRSWLDPGRVVARVGVGVTVRQAGTIPNVKTADGLKQALESADSIVYNEGSSGLYLDKLFAQMGIGEKLKAKTTRYPNGGQVAQHVVSGKGNEIAFLPISYILSNASTGIAVCGPASRGHTELHRLRGCCDDRQQRSGCRQGFHQISDDCTCQEDFLGIRGGLKKAISDQLIADSSQSTPVVAKTFFEAGVTRYRIKLFASSASFDPDDRIAS